MPIIPDCRDESGCGPFKEREDKSDNYNDSFASLVLVYAVRIRTIDSPKSYQKIKK